MNDVILALIAELYAQISQLRQENQRLTEALQQARPDAPWPPHHGAGGAESRE